MKDKEKLEAMISSSGSLEEGLRIAQEARLEGQREGRQGVVLQRKAKYYGRNRDRLDYYVILARLDDKSWGKEYVTWEESKEDGSRYSGHYFMNHEDALEDFKAR